MDKNTEKIAVSVKETVLAAIVGAILFNLAIVFEGLRKGNRKK